MLGLRRRVQPDCGGHCDHAVPHCRNDGWPKGAFVAASRYDTCQLELGRLLERHQVVDHDSRNWVERGLPPEQSEILNLPMHYRRTELAKGHVKTIDECCTRT